MRIINHHFLLRLKHFPPLAPVKTVVKFFLRRLDLIQKSRKSIRAAQKSLVHHSPKRILFWSTGGMPDLLKIDAAFAFALKLRGHHVHFVICDGIYSACVKREISDKKSTAQWHTDCVHCKKENALILQSLNIEYSTIGDWIASEDLAQASCATHTININNISRLIHDGITIGPNIESSALRYLSGFDLTVQPEILKPYTLSAILNTIAAKKLLEHFKCDALFMSHGIYVEWGPALKVALSKKIPVVAWLSGQIPVNFMFRKITQLDSTYVFDVDNDMHTKIQSRTFNDEKKQHLEKYFEKRYGFNLLNATLPHKEKISSLLSQHNIKDQRPIWGILTHINWDGVRDCAPMLYNNFNEWLIDTLQHIQKIKNVHWLIKIHPAELRYNAPNDVRQVIKRNFPVLPDNISIIHPEDQITLSDFAHIVNGAVTVYGTLGLELAVTGKPIILCGKTHYAEKGFTFDAQNKEHYHELLNNASQLSTLPPEKILAAQKYAFSFFVERHIPVPSLKHENVNLAAFDWNKLEDLLPGKDPYLDLICDDIVNNGTFELNEDLIKLKSLYPL